MGYSTHLCPCADLIRWTAVQSSLDRDKLPALSVVNDFKTFLSEQVFHRYVHRLASGTWIRPAARPADDNLPPYLQTEFTQYT